MKAPIHSTKHYVQQTITGVAAAAVVNVQFATSVESTIANAVDEVAEGTVIKAIFVEMWIIDEGANGSAVALLEKIPSGQTSPTAANMAALGTYLNKKNVLYTTMGLTPNDGIAQPRLMTRDWFKIPKGKQRMGLGDRIVYSIRNFSAQQANICGFATYKEYS